MANELDTRARAPRRTRSDHHARVPGPSEPRRSGLFAGGTEGNERLTVLTGLLLIVLFAALGITILQIGPLLWEHFFIGFILIGPVLLKLASTGYRFMRYYSGNERYHIKGPPPIALRLLAPALIGLTVLVFASGVVLLFIGPASSLRNDAFLVHKASFILWIGAFGVHILGHLPEIFRLLRISAETRSSMIAARSAGSRGRVATPVQPAFSERVPGGGARWLSLATGLVLGLLLAIVLIPHFGVWTYNVAATLHHGGGH